MPKKISNYDNFLVQGVSMLPTIKPNQKAKIVKTQDVKIGDIIVYKSVFQPKNKKSIRRIIHKIVKIDDNKIITKGDHRLICDSPITSKEILGKVIKIGNKKIDTNYYNYINPFLAKLSYFNALGVKLIRYETLTRQLKKGYYRLDNFKKKHIGGERLYLWWLICLFDNLPNKINHIIFRLLNK